MPQHPSLSGRTRCGVRLQPWCAGETSKKSRMKESHREGLASHPDPESCVDGREAAREARTGVQTGRAIELRKRLLSSADAVKARGRPHGRDHHRKSASGSAESKNLCACLETSCAGTRRSRWCRRGGTVGRKGKAMSDKPFMHAVGKSDSPVVPTKAPNKEDRHSAEGLEGSGLIEENVVESHTGRTQWRKAVFQRRDGVRQACRHHPR